MDSEENSAPLLQIGRTEEEQEAGKLSSEEEDLIQQDSNTQEEDWIPDKAAFISGFLAISPFLSYVCYKMGTISIGYLLMNVLSIPLGFKLRDQGGLIRWSSAFITVVSLSAFKTATIQSSDDTFPTKAIYFAFCSLWECSNAVYIFGGRDIQEKYGINSIARAFLAVSCPAQIKFVQQPVRIDRWQKRSLHLAAYLFAFYALRFLMHFVEDTIESFAVLEAEAIVILFSCIVHLWNIPSHLYQLIMMRYPIQVIYPYGSIYFSTSSREFWSRWGRPASSMIRYMFYYPLGGSSRAWLSIPVMFLLNASSHYSVSDALVGDEAKAGWNIVFGVLGLTATVEVIGDKFFANGRDDGMAPETPKFWRTIRFLVAVVSFRFAAYFLFRKCLNSSVAGLLPGHK